MPLTLRTAASLPFCAALCSGCAEAPPPRIEILRPEIPAALLRCPEKPAAPGPKATQRDAALFIVDLTEAHALCRDRLGAVRRLIASPAVDPEPTAPAP